MTQEHDETLPQGVVREILDALRELPVAKPGAALRARALAAARGAAPPAVLVVRADEGAWLEIAPGVAAKVLFEDGRMRTWLARMQPGATFPAHAHPEHEECFVLQGDLEGDGVEVTAGDYQVALRGSAHGVVRTRGGCLLLLRSARC